MRGPHKIKVCTVHVPHLRLTCTQCRKELVNGQYYAIGIIEDYEKYFICEDVFRCTCGAEKNMPLLFTNERDADDSREEITGIIRTERSVSSYNVKKVSEIANIVTMQ